MISGTLLKTNKKTFNVVANLVDEATENMIGFARYCVAREEDSVDVYMTTVESVKSGRGPQGILPKISKENEAAAWRFINRLADRALKKYPTTLIEDVQLLNQDKGETKLTPNIRHCIMFRKTEKVILHFLKDCAKRAEYIMKLKSYEAAKKEIRTWNNLEKERCGLYFLTTLCDLVFDIERNRSDDEEKAKQHEKYFLGEEESEEEDSRGRKKVKLTEEEYMNYDHGDEKNKYVELF